MMSCSCFDQSHKALNAPRASLLLGYSAKLVISLQGYQAPGTFGPHDLCKTGLGGPDQWPIFDLMV